MAKVKTKSVDTPGFDHALGFYTSDEEFTRLVSAHCESGHSADEPTIIWLEPRKIELVRSALEEPDQAVFLPHDKQYLHPPGALATVLELTHRYTAGGTRPLRLVGELPSLTGLTPDAWLRYEAAVNHALQDLPVRGLCTYDATATCEVVQAEALRTHHTIATADGGYQPNMRYEPPDAFIANRVQVARDPLEDGPPDVELVNPSPSATRQAIAALARDMRLDTRMADDLLVGVTEVLTNALLHSHQPVVVQGWGTPGRVVVAVRDPGDGPDDPFAGLLPAEPGAQEGGLGLRITQQLCPETSLSITEDGFTVRLAVGPVADAIT